VGGLGPGPPGPLKSGLGSQGSESHRSWSGAIELGLGYIMSYSCSPSYQLL